jgi:hypothetical protein
MMMMDMDEEELIINSMMPDELSEAEMEIRDEKRAFMGKQSQRCSATVERQSQSLSCLVLQLQLLFRVVESIIEEGPAVDTESKGEGTF